MLACVALLSAVAVLASESDQAAFEAFVEKYGRGYVRGSASYLERFKLFQSRADEVRRLNADPTRRWTAGVGPLADYTEEELAQLRGWRGMAAASDAGTALLQVNSLPEEF
ncbi:unnamed protein product [Durusdinium trenchii]|uniref:Cathepsin propeptide inhibitor domain-containing protein n=2 Tax=Durusdinium trenchii TaxID=1381693 RepID=A0ABP0RYQ8_9DINO